MTDPTDSPPHIAIVRFSALGDVVMVAAAVSALQQTWPDAKITWFTSPLAYSLLKGMPGVSFVVTERPRTLSDYLAFYRSQRGKRFDAVLALQANLRINLLYPALRAPLKIGFDRVRARELQWLFCNRSIPFKNDHLVDSFLSIVEALTGKPAVARWELPLDASDRQWARARLGDLRGPLLAIHPYASKTERNWLPDRYATIIEQAVLRFRCNILLTGGPAADEIALCARLAGLVPDRTVNLCGQTTPKQLAALLEQADVLLAPDTGAVHIARAMGTPVIGLYAVAPPALTGPYMQQSHCIDRYPQAVRALLDKDPAQVPWNTRVHHPDAMSLIEVGDVMLRLEQSFAGESLSVSRDCPHPGRKAEPGEAGVLPT